MTATATAASNMFDLIKTKSKPSPDRIVIYGGDGVGKTSFAAQWPNIFGVLAGHEDGLDKLASRGLVPNIPHTPLIEDLPSLSQWLTFLRDEEHGFSAVFVDSVGQVEQLFVDHIVKKKFKGSIEKFSSFGAGWKEVYPLWQSFLEKLQVLRDDRQMDVILLGHECRPKYRNPSGEDFYRHECRLQSTIWGWTKEWADMVLFFDTYVETVEDDKGAVKAKGGKERICKAARDIQWDAKNRHGLPDTFSLGNSPQESFKLFMSQLKKENISGRSKTEV